MDAEKRKQALKLIDAKYLSWEESREAMKKLRALIESSEIDSEDDCIIQPQLPDDLPPEGKWRAAYGNSRKDIFSGMNGHGE